MSSPLLSSSSVSSAPTAVRAGIAGAVLAVLALLAGCGGAAYEPHAPGVGSPPREPEPATIEEAQAKIQNARAELEGRSVKASTSDSAGAAADAAPKAEPPAPPPSTSTSTPSSESSQREFPAKTSADKCSSPCRALTSMRTAVNALCRMTGAEDSRCVDAQKTLSDSEKRVTPCSC